MNKAFLNFIPIFFISAVFFSSCSLRYGMNVQDENNVPEFVFGGVNFSRYEDGEKTLSLSAEKLEQYKDGKSMYAKNLDFSVYDENGDVTNSGKCGYLAADTDAENYALYDDIEIRNEKDDLNVQAESLKWNGKSEQLTSGRNAAVVLKKGETVIQGSGFSASGVSKRFSFTGNVSGNAENVSDNTENVSDKSEQDGGNGSENEPGADGTETASESVLAEY